MRMERLTTKSQEALRTAMDRAARAGNPELVPEHLLGAILEQKDGVGGPLVDRAGVAPAVLKKDLDQRLETLPKVTGGAEPTLGRRVKSGQMTPLKMCMRSAASRMSAAGRFWIR